MGTGLADLELQLIATFELQSSIQLLIEDIMLQCQRLMVGMRKLLLLTSASESQRACKKQPALVSAKHDTGRVPPRTAFGPNLQPYPSQIHGPAKSFK